MLDRTTSFRYGKLLRHQSSCRSIMLSMNPLSLWLIQSRCDWYLLPLKNIQHDPDMVTPCIIRHYYGRTPNKDKQSWVDAVLRCTLYSVYACTRCMLYSVSTHDHDMERQRKMTNFVFCNDGRVGDEKERDGGWRWEQCGGYKRIWQITATTCLIGLWRPLIGLITHWIGTHTCRIGDGTLNRTRNSLKSHFLTMISLIFPHLYLSRPQLYHLPRTQS